MRLLGLISSMALGLSSASAWASDHIDGVPSLDLHEQVDLTDLYLFQTPNRPGSLTIILNLYPGVEDDGHFSSKVGYNIKIRPVTVQKAPTVGFVTDKRLQVTANCTFGDPGHHQSGGSEIGSVRCAVFGNSPDQAFATVQGRVGETLTDPANRIRLFTGPRSDPFFIGREQFKSVTEREGFQPAKPGQYGNLMERINVLSIALEINWSQLFPSSASQMYAVAAESYAVAGGNTMVLDRVGRPEITNLSLHSFGESAPIKESYNQLKAFSTSADSDLSPYKRRLTENITQYDENDGNNKKNWNQASLDILTTLLLEDFLVIDLSLPCQDRINGYLSLEKALLTGTRADSCGGRRLRDDIMNVMYALYIGGPSAKLDDYETGVNRPYQSSDKKLSNTFPYLAGPESTGFWSFNLKRFLLNKILKGRQD